MDVHPEDGEPFRAEVPDAGHGIGNFTILPSLNFEPPTKGDTVTVEFDPKTKKTRFDLSDPRLQQKASRKARDKAQHADYEAALGAPPASTDPSGLGGDPELAELLELDKAETGAARAPSAAPASGPEARLAQLQQLADLHDRGVLNDDELEAEKARILSES